MASEYNAERSGTVFDIGYRSYEGEREGRTRAWKTIFWDGVKNGMGIGRGGWAKFLPWLVVSPTIAAGLIFAGIATFFDQLTSGVDADGVTDEFDFLNHEVLTSITAFLLLIFAAFVGPELVCPDRRNRVIQLYFVRPITMVDYLGARWAALVLLLLAAALLPHLTLWVGLLIGVSDATEHLRENWSDILRFTGSSMVYAVFIASFTLAISSLTDRRMIGTLIVISVVMISSLVPAILQIFQPPDGVNDLIALVDMIGFNSSILPSIFYGTYGDNYDLNISLPIVWVIILTAGSLVATWRFYQSQR